MKLGQILIDIENERLYQEEKWGEDFDNKNTLNDWVTYINIYAGRAAEMAKTDEEAKLLLLKAATLAVAAIEAHGRNDGWAKRHYDK